MKIGILTFHDTTNFGSLLQTYGLYKKIVDLGFDCEVIDYQCESIVKREIPAPFRFSTSIKKMYRSIRYDTIIRKKYKRLSDFLHSNMILSERCDKNSISEVCEKYDKIIVGSDIVWGLDIVDGDRTYFLDFIKDGNKKYAFSSSVGNAWNDEEKSIVKPLLNDFRYISVREEEASNWINELIGFKPDVVCDPTMLLDTKEWLQFVKKEKSVDKYVLVYFDTKNADCRKGAIKYAQANNLIVKQINYGQANSGAEPVKPYSISDFLSLIYNAEKVFTASYHGMLFSLYFNRQLVFYNRAHKSRMNTIANKLFVDSCNGEGADVNNMPVMDYETIRKAITEYRNRSLRCLNRILYDK